MKLISITKSHKPDKKLDATFETDGRTKTTSFGQSGAPDFTKTHDVEQRERYRSRHAKDLHTKDPTKAGYLAWFILWNKPTVKSSIADYKKRFNL
jgi:hypothetical protein